MLLLMVLVDVTVYSMALACTVPWPMKFEISTSAVKMTEDLLTEKSQA